SPRPPPPPSPPPPPPPSPPPPRPKPPSPPPPLSPPPPCTSCIYTTLTPGPTVLIPYELTSSDCAKLANVIQANVSSKAAALGAVLLSTPTVTCDKAFVKVCFTFKSDQDGALLMPFIADLTQAWLDAFLSPGCPSYLSGYTVSVTAGPDGDPFNPAAEGCLFSEPASIACASDSKPSNYPACECVTRARATPFMANPKFTVISPGRKNYTKLYCFSIAVVTPTNPNVGCGRSKILRNVEFFANDSQRPRVKGVGLKPAGAASMTFFSEIWGPVGDQTLKTPVVNWNTTQANGAQVCLEVEYLTDLNTFFNGSNTCWISLFDESKNCCPTFATTAS
ncbi:hypothetical protein Vretimale_14967, partial [Volvox reticuliferus]